ncbi:MAG: nucleotidyltransferase family protein [Caldilineaceae bacterium]|nr:nucleotidyltransferase family protein [Caldilineaceae bacterium]
MSKADLVLFCQRWQITELALFGSALRPDFGPDSDIDLLVTFAPGAKWSLFDHMSMELELVDLFQREVDLIDRRALEQGAPSRRRAEILNSAQVIFFAPEIDSAPEIDHAVR